MSATLNRLVHMKLNEISPDVYEKCLQIATPPVRDQNLLPGIMSILVQRNVRSSENISFIIGVAYYLVAPHKLYSNNIKLAPGIRSIIKDGLGFNNAESINHYSTVILPMWKNARYKQRVEAEATEIMNLIDEVQSANNYQDAQIEYIQLP
jgi:transcriptional regulator of nitric oxide reductase